MEIEKTAQPTSESVKNAANAVGDAVSKKSTEGGLNILKKAKKTAVAISGGALVAIGIPLIPLPGK